MGVSPTDTHTLYALHIRKEEKIMAKMFEIKGKTAIQNAFLAFAAYNRAKALVDEHNGKIDFVDGKNIKATFKSNKVATDFVTAFESEYEKAHKAYTKAKGKTETKTTSARKPKADAPKKAKGNGIDFKAFKGTNSEKNKALHAMLVSKGITNSKTEEYMSVWNARPWAK
jgi:hypothetical protein